MRTFRPRWTTWLLGAVLLLSALVRADVIPEPPAAPDPVVAPYPAVAPSVAQHPEGIEKAAPMGVIQGGWGYVYACYLIVIGGTVLYALSLYLRRPRGSEGTLP